MVKNHISQYLRRYAEPEAIALQCPVSLHAEHCLIVPCYDECFQDLAYLQTTAFVTVAPILIIFLINQPDDQQDITKNRQLWQAFYENGSIMADYGSYFYSQWRNNIITLVVDRFSQHKIPVKQGVGLARKIACDIACQLFQMRYLTNCWIHSSDADTRLPTHYFATTDQLNSSISAALYSFSHTLPEKIDHPNCREFAIKQATELYETAINYYVDGLAWANSPYAFHTIGSCMVINSLYYVQARGFPKRAAGEDFYLLNKLAKLGNIHSIRDCSLRITPRLSSRAPFGTGPAVKVILDQAYTITNYPYYHPMIFHILKQTLKYLTTRFAEDSYNHRHDRQSLSHLPSIIAENLMSLGVKRLIRHLEKQVKNEIQAQQAVLEWFDAFKTLKFVHQLELYYPKIPLKQAIHGLEALKRV